jgi:SNF2 family DNA or RNA helicase
MQYRPYPYQQYCQEAILEHPNIGLFLDMGLGKTVITLTALHELKYRRFAIHRALVITLAKIAEGTWQAEAAKWEHLRGLRVVPVIGTAKQRTAALETPADVYVISRNNTQWLVDRYRSGWPFDVVVLDESSSFKNHASKRFKALKGVRPQIARLIELTGTPRPKSLMDLWAQVYLLDGGKRLGRTISCYRDMYFTPGRRNRTTIFTYDPKPGAEDAVYAAISDICISMKAEDYLELPGMLYDDIPVVLDRKAQEAYDRLERDAVLEVQEDVITASTSAALSSKLLQLCNGAVYDEDRNIVPVHNCKLQALLETVEQLGGQHALVCYYFVHDRDRMLEALRVTGLRVRVYRGQQDQDDWNSGEIDLMLVHPASCGYGLNLQQGGHHVIWFSLPWSLEEYQQTNRRLYRQGQTQPVIIHHLLVRGGRDEDVIRSLGRKDGAQETMMQTLKARIERVREEQKR